MGQRRLPRNPGRRSDQGAHSPIKVRIVNDADNWAIETKDNPRYPMEVFQRVATVNLHTQHVLWGFPK